MKRKSIMSLIIAVAAALTFQAVAHAEDIGNGSIRVTISAEDEDKLGIRYTTEDDQVQTGMKPSEVLHLNTFGINGWFLLPSPNAFTMVKGGNTLVIGVQGDQDDDVVRLNFEQEGMQAELFLPSDIEIGTLAANKVEILDENDQVVAEVTDELKDYTSVNGMSIHFVIGEEEAQDEEGDDEGNIDLGDNDDLDNGDGQPAAGGCSLMTSASGSADLSALLAFSGLALAALRRLKK